jgi:hypothetical protein
MDAALQKRPGNFQVQRGRYHNTDRIDQIQELVVVVNYRTTCLARYLVGTFGIRIHDADQLDVGHMGIDQRMEAA